MKNTLSSHSLNDTLIKAALQIVKGGNAQFLFVYSDALGDDKIEIPKNFSKHCNLIFYSQKNQNNRDYSYLPLKKTLKLPNIKLGRLGLIKFTIALAISQQIIKNGDRVVFLNGSSSPAMLDTIWIVDIGKEAEIITRRGVSDITESLRPEVFEQVLSLAVELANKGREGKPVGTMFVVGDQDRVMQLSKQMIINPFKGYEEEERNILNPQLKETIREFSAIDGAFIIADDGVVITAGRYLGAAYDEDDVPRGLGSRHIAAAGITALTNAIAIVISESTGDVRIFKSGKIIMEIEKP